MNSGENCKYCVCSSCAKRTNGSCYNCMQCGIRVDELDQIYANGGKTYCRGYTRKVQS